jgi:hypothetical protein
MHRPRFSHISTNSLQADRRFGAAARLMPHVSMFRLVARRLWKWGQARDRELDPGH